MSNIKGKIDKNGCLLIERSNGVYKHQICPYNNNYCRDNCPLFGEIEEWSNKTIHLIICKKQLRFDKNTFIDERKDPNNYEIDMQADLTQEICKRYWDLQERIEVIENIAKQIKHDEYISGNYTKKAEEFAKDSIEIMQRTIKVLKNFEGDVIEFDDNKCE